MSDRRQARAREIAQHSRGDYDAAQRFARNATVWWIIFGIGAIVLGGVAGYAGLVQDAPEAAGWLGVAAAVFAAVDTALGSKAKRDHHRARGAGLLGLAEKADNLATSDEITQQALDDLAAERGRLHEPDMD